jgi:DNA-binding CsgD family transcriptional regulator
VQVATEVGARDLEGYARNTMGVGLTMLGESAAGLAELAKALRIAKERGDTWELGRTYVNYSDGLLHAGEWARAAEIGMEGVQVCRRLGYGRTTGMCAAGNTLSALIRLGRWTDADRLADDVRDPEAPPWQRWVVTLALAELELRRGRPDGARRQLASLAETVAVSDDIDLASAYHACSAQLAIADGDDPSAREHVRLGLKVIRGSEFTRRGPELCATGLRAGGDPGVLLAECRDLLTGLRSMPEPEAYARQAEAEASGDPGAWREAAAGWARLGEAYHVAYCRFREAEAILAARGSRTEAGAALGAARETAVRLGAAGLRGEIDALARRARLSEGVTRPESAPMSGLTPREIEVLALLSEGRTNRQIAGALFISERTVGVHVSRILHKLGVPNRGAAVHLFRAAE